MRFALLFMAGAVVIGFLAGVGLARLMAFLDDYEVVYLGSSTADVD